MAKTRLFGGSHQCLVGAAIVGMRNYPPRACSSPDALPPIHNAMARFNQVTDVTDAERDVAWQRILAAATRFGVASRSDNWRDLPSGAGPSSKQ